MSKELWRPVPGLDGFYEVSTFGRVRSKDRIIRTKNGPRLVKGRVRALHSGSERYMSCHIWVNGNRKSPKVHILVCRSFLGEKPSVEHEVNHKDGNRSNNHLENLEWCTPSQNMVHAFHVLRRKGPPPSNGENNQSAKLSITQVNEIRLAFKMGVRTVTIASNFGISPTHARRIRSGVYWAMSQASGAEGKK